MLCIGASSCCKRLACSPSARMCEDIPETESPYAAEGTLAHEICELKLTKAYTLALGPKAFTTRLNKLKKHELYQDEMLKCSRYLFGLYCSIMLS